MDPKIDLLAQVFAIILSWPDPRKTAPSETVVGDPGADDESPARKGQDVCIVSETHPSDP